MATTFLLGLYVNYYKDPFLHSLLTSGDFSAILLQKLSGMP